MLPPVTAIRFDKPVTSGKTKSYLVGGVQDDDRSGVGREVRRGL